MYFEPKNETGRKLTGKENFNGTSKKMPLQTKLIFSL